MKSLSTRPSITFGAPAQQQLYTRYGDPRAEGWEARWMERWPIREEFPWFPEGRLYLHRDFKPLLQTAFAALEEKGLHGEIRSCEGCFGIRYVAGPYSVLSVHSWGAAIDLNASGAGTEAPLRWSNNFLDTMLRARIFCGSLWRACPDPSHFSMVGG